MMNSKPRPPNNYQLRSPYIPTYSGPPGQTVSHQCPQPGIANPHSNTNLRCLSCPPQQQPLQPLVNQQSHDGVTGDQEQQQVFGAPYPQAQIPGMQYQPRIYQSYLQPMFNPQNVYPDTRFVLRTDGYYHRNAQNPLSTIAATYQQNPNAQGIRQYVPQPHRAYLNAQGTHVQQQRHPTPSVHGVPHGVQLTPNYTKIHPSHHQHQRSVGQVCQPAVVPNQHENRDENVPAPLRSYSVRKGKVLFLDESSRVSPMFLTQGTEAQEHESPVLVSNRLQQAPLTIKATSHNFKNPNLLSVSPVQIQHSGTLRSQSSTQLANSQPILKKDSNEISDTRRSLIQVPGFIKTPQDINAAIYVQKGAKTYSYSEIQSASEMLRNVADVPKLHPELFYVPWYISPNSNIEFRSPKELQKREILRINLYYFSRISRNLEVVVLDLKTLGVLTREDVSHIEKYETPLEKGVALFTKLIVKDRDELPLIIVVMKQTDNEEIAFRLSRLSTRASSPVNVPASSTSLLQTKTKGVQDFRKETWSCPRTRYHSSDLSNSKKCSCPS